MPPLRAAARFRPAFEPGRTGAFFFAALLCLLLSRPAAAALTCPVPGIEEELNSAWSKTPGCEGLLVEDLVPREGGVFALLTNQALTLSVEHGGGVCSAGTWSIGRETADAKQGDGCLLAACRVLAGRTSALDAFARPENRKDSCHEALAPMRQIPPPLTPLRVVWIACCLIALLGPLLIRFRLPRERLPWTLLPIVALGVGLRVWAALHLRIQGDEFSSWGNTHLLLELNGIELPNNPPLYRVLSWPLAALTQGDPAWGRLVPVLLGGVLIVLAFRVGARFLSSGAGLPLALLAAVHPGLVLATTYHRSYALLVVVAAAALLAVDEALEQPSRWTRLNAALLAAAVFLTHYLAATFLLGLLVAVALSHRRGRWRDWLWPAGVSLLLAAPFLPMLAQGMRIKVDGGSSAVGPAHALHVLLAAPGVMAGLLVPSLQAAIVRGDNALAMAAWSAVGLLLVLLGWWRLPREARLLLGGTWLAGILPGSLVAIRVHGIREFQFLAAALPALACIVAAIMRLKRPTIAFVLLLACFSFGLSRLDGRSFAAEASCRARFLDPGDAPISVWPPDEFQRAVRAVGGSRAVADLSTAGQDQRVRMLRSCSSAAVREAAGRSRATVHLVLLAGSCQIDALTGRGVSCVPISRFGNDEEVRCQVAIGAVVQRTFRVNTAAAPGIGPGHEADFIAAAAPYALGGTVRGAYRLMWIRIGPETVRYTLEAPGARQLVLEVSADGAISGGSSAQAAQALEGALRQHLTPAFWRRVLTK